VQFPVIAPVVYVLPDKEPPHPLTDEMAYPLLGVTVNDVEPKKLTDCGVEGLIVPPEPADGVTVNAPAICGKKIRIKKKTPMIFFNFKCAPYLLMIFKILGVKALSHFDESILKVTLLPIMLVSNPAELSNLKFCAPRQLSDCTSIVATFDPEFKERTIPFNIRLSLPA
jgi:hypothetical protein